VVDDDEDKEVARSGRRVKKGTGTGTGTGGGGGGGDGSGSEDDDDFDRSFYLEDEAIDAGQGHGFDGAFLGNAEKFKEREEEMARQRARGDGMGQGSSCGGGGHRQGQGQHKTVGMSAKRSQLNVDQQRWEDRLLMNSGVGTRTEAMAAEANDDEDDTRVQIMVHQLKPPFLDGRLDFSTQQEMVSTVKDATSDMATCAK
jgi:pre-mRNA-splicing factor ATP-dependent RNA helicase DHX38/PRP16